MWQRLRLKLTNKWVALVGTAGAGMLPCPDCGVPLAVHIWPVAGAIWLYRRWQRRSIARLDLALTNTRSHPAPDAAAHDPIPGSTSGTDDHP